MTRRRRRRRQHEHASKRRSDQGGGGIRVEPWIEKALCSRVLEQPAKGGVPGFVRLVEHGRDRRVARRPLGQLAHHGEQLRLIANEAPHAVEMGFELRSRRAARHERRTKPLHGVADHRADQRLLGAEVVVKRRHVHADVVGDVTCPQALEACVRHAPVCGQDQRLAPGLGIGRRLRTTSAGC